ncbi:MAG: VWA domain-containing protein, partial [Ignavibacteriales bacterium]|nr:VWA domain-containing protein [Ignavibacteriales bacterium]
MILAELFFSLQGNLLVLSLLLLIGIGLAWLFYRYTLPPLPPRRRVILSTLRALTLSLILMLFFEPILHLIQRDEQPPIVAVLVDNSQSMTLNDGSESLRRFLKSEQFKSLSSPVEVRTYSFSSTLPKATLESPDSLRFNGETTNLSEVFSQIKKRLVSENIQSVVLVSDGNFTVGKNPIYDAEALGIPVYTVGVGDTIEQKDLLVEKVVTNNIAYAETKVPVDVTIKSSGFGGENVEVILREGTAVVDRKVITVENGTREYPVRLSIEPKEEGMMKYSVNVSELEGELTMKNNVQTFFVKVLKSKLRVLILAGAPSPDVPAIRQALTEEQHFNVQARIQKNGQEFYEGTVSRSLFDSADCFVLVGFPSKQSSSQLLQELRVSIEQAKKPVLFVNGKSTDEQKLTLIEPLLPFSWSNSSQMEALVFASVSEKQKANTLVRLEGTVSAETWQQMPPIYKTQTMFRIKPEAEILAAVRIQNIVLPEPLVATRNVNRMKSYAITGYGVWRWNLLADEQNEQSEFLQMLFVNAVRWLTTKDEGKNVRVSPTKEMFTTAEPIEFTAQVYDEQLRPADDAELTVTLQHGKETKELALSAIGNGLYEGASDSIGEGDYTYEG